MDNLDESTQSHLSCEQGQVATFASIASDATTPTKPKVARPFLERVGRSAQVRGYADDANRTAAYEAMAKDARELPLMALAARYPGEYHSHRGAKRAPKARGIPFDLRLSDFRNWLIHLGPKPEPNFTIDRINTFEGYKLGNLRWACKVRQTENRRSTKWVRLPDDSTVTMRQLAVMAGKPYNTVRQQRRRGWSVERILERTATGDPLREWQFPPLAREQLEKLYKAREKFGQSRLDWMVEHLQKLERRATDAGLAYEARHLQVQVSRFMAEREQLKAKATTVLSKSIRGLIDDITHKPAKPSPLPHLPPPKPPATTCIAVKPAKVEEPKATQEQVLEMLRKLGKKGCSEVDPSLHLDKPTECKP